MVQVKQQYKTPLPFFRQKKFIPRRYEISVLLLRTLSFVPALITSFQNLRLAKLVPLRDAGGPLIIQTTQAEYYVTILWVKNKPKISSYSTKKNIVYIVWILELDLYQHYGTTMDIPIRNKTNAHSTFITTIHCDIYTFFSCSSHDSRRWHSSTTCHLLSFITVTQFCT